MANEEKEILFYEDLFKLRKSNNIQINDISENTKINPKYIEAIERGDFDSLPNIYVRLFIRSYAEYLGADSKSILKKYEEHVQIKPKKFLKLKNKKEDKNQKIEKNTSENKSKEKQLNISFNKIEQSSSTIKTKNSPKNEKKEKKSNFKKNNFDTEYFLSPDKLIKIFSTFSIFIIIYLLISYLSNEQKNNVTSNSNINKNIQTNSIEIDYNILINNDDYKNNNFIEKKTYKLKNKLSDQYTFQIVTKNKTKIHVSHDDDLGNKIKDCNIIAPKDTLLQFKNKNNIYFDLWSAKDVEMSINNKPISRYIGNNDVLIRGSFNPFKKELNLDFYNH